MRILVAIAERRKGLDAERCRLVFAHLDTAAWLRSCLHEVLARHQLSDLQFAALVVLFALEPEPISTAVLADHTAVSRPAVTEMLDKLEARQLATRTRDDHDRRVIYVQITAAGREAIDQAINDYLRAAAQAARHVQAPERRRLFATYVQLLRGVMPPDQANGPSESAAS